MNTFICSSYKVGGGSLMGKLGGGGCGTLIVDEGEILCTNNFDGTFNLRD